ncbi:MAG: NHLP bacteriocin system secretion protein [Coleofasciculus chthonoplastes F3-SA18-01]|jgi:HlyD family secretion protein|uniref:NHLP bacteriocin system secretion protein n=1 Tax=Coleofasciculus chthonoplastes TaxID=64178 RepID=UPI0032F71777
MVDQKTLFRQESLERLSSPERLDQLMKVVSPKDWLPLATLGSLVGIAFIWSIVGRIPITASGQGVLIYPRQVVDVQSTSSGQIKELKVKVGDRVNADDVIATVELPEIQKQLQQQKEKLKELQQQNRGVNQLQSERTQLELRTIEQQRQSIQERIRNIESLTPILQQRITSSIQQQRQSILERINNTEALTPILRDQGREALKAEREAIESQLENAEKSRIALKRRWDVREGLFNRLATDANGNPILDKDGNPIKGSIITEDLVLQAEQDYLNNEANIGNLKARLRELEARQTQAEKNFRDNLNSISELKAQLKELDGREAEAQKNYRDNLNSLSELRAQLRDLDSKIPNLKQQNLESLTSRENQIQEVKREIAKLELQLQKNSEIRSPHTGRVLELTATNGQVLSPGSRLGSIEAQRESEELVAVTFFAVQDGKKIEQRMKDLKALGKAVEVQVTPTTVKRERFGGIKGTVTDVSAFPITKEGVALSVGNAQVVESLVTQVPQLKVVAQLKPDSSTFSGYAWSSSKGPPMKMTSGITTTVRATVEEVPPITFVLPFLRSFFGLS